RIDFDTFARNFIEEFALEVSPAQVQHEFLEFVQAPMPGWDAVLHQLKQRYHLSLLSNTNSAHYKRLRDRYDFYAPFEQVFLSHNIGLMKPDPAIFYHVLTVLNIAPHEAAFFDDGARNVAAANSVGINAYQVNSPQELQNIIAALGPV
ncbi:MAG: HAD-IA family hydrolase, partial [Cyanobacteria bacterium P01_C01_bin.147]